MSEKKGFFDWLADKAKKLLDKTEVGRELNAGNQMKEDLEQGKYEGLPNLHHADDYAHRYADAKIGQRGAAAVTAGFAIGVGKEMFDITHKIIRGDSVKATLKDSLKDMRNNMEGLKWGYTHRDQDPHEWLAELDLETNTFKKGHNNGVAAAMKRDKQRADVCKQKKQEELLEQNTVSTSATAWSKSALSANQMKDIHSKIER
ncbi:MAG: hypothetical protein IJS88_01635 [Alphaproteobacteria bacterium]|nr:hypothetical protein [Alphaproteobacteria bacterium]